MTYDSISSLEVTSTVSSFKSFQRTNERTEDVNKAFYWYMNSRTHKDDNWYYIYCSSCFLWIIQDVWQVKQQIFLAICLGNFCYNSYFSSWFWMENNWRWHKMSYMWKHFSLLVSSSFDVNKAKLLLMVQQLN